MREADSAACGKEDVKLGQQLHFGIQPAEWRRQGAPGVHTKEGDPLVLEYGWDGFAWCLLLTPRFRVRLRQRGRNRNRGIGAVTKRA